MAEPKIDGCVQFYITTTPDEMQRWPAQAITDFFNGLAQVVYAAGQNATVEVTELGVGRED
jgi:hypothetical protein